MGCDRILHSSTVQYLYDRYVGEDPQRIAEYDEALLEAEIGRRAYDLRQQVGLTHNELAARVGAPANDLVRLEEADYKGSALALLQRIAAALDQRVQIGLVPAA